MREFLTDLVGALKEILYGILKFIMSWISIVDDDTPSAPPPSKSKHVEQPFNPYSRSAWKKKAWKQFKK